MPQKTVSTASFLRVFSPFSYCRGCSAFPKVRVVLYDLWWTSALIRVVWLLCMSHPDPFFRWALVALPGFRAIQSMACLYVFFLRVMRANIL